MTLTRISEILHEWTGWCPHNAAPDRQVMASAHQEESAFSQVKPPLPQQGSRKHARGIEVPGWMATIAIVVLFGTLFFGGSLSWLIVVFAVLIACLTYWYLSCIRGWI